MIILFGKVFACCSVIVMKLSAVGPTVRSFRARVRRFSTQGSGQQQPSVIFVGRDDGLRQNELLGPSKQFPLPGDVRGQVAEQKKHTPLSVESYTLGQVLETTRVDASREYLFKMQEEAAAQAEADEEAKLGDWPVELTAQECPRLLRRDLKQLFPSMTKESLKGVNVINLTQKSETDMSAWSHEMEAERNALTATFISTASAVCETLRRCGYWADFVDPSSGRPFFGQFTNSALFETDPAYQQMGFRIEDLGCCKVLSHAMWGTHAFVGTIFTDAPLDAQIVKDIVCKVNDRADA